MKMVKSLLLGSAAGLVAIAGAQAADLPVKAKPVQYVKICSLYGVGFYYIPGTDMCIKIGGWVRAQYMFGIENGTNGPLLASAPGTVTGAAAGTAGGGLYNRNSDDGFLWRARGYITADARQQTAYGTARAYIAVGRSSDMAGAFSSNRAFIQWAGFTFGLAASFYDFYSGPAVSYYGGQIVPASDTGDGGNFVGAYTAQFGNGLSASISVEDDRANRATGVFNPLNPANTLALNTTYANAYAAPNTPDVVANLRVDQAWGGAQIMGAIHQVTSIANSAALNNVGMTQHAGDKTGFAVGGGLKLNAPMIGTGDYLQAQVNYTEGALGYLFAGRGDALYSGFRNGGTYGYGIVADGVVTGVAAASTLQLTTGWGVNASYEHFWNAQWKTSVYGVYDDIKYNAVANATICANSAALLIGATGNPLCNNDFQYWAVGSRTQWNVTPQFYMGVDVVYTKLQTASAGMTTGQGAATPAAATGQPAGLRTVQDQDAWIGYFRVHYDFYP
jgi:hypothetical protein